MNNKRIMIIVDYKNLVNILRGKKIKEKKVVFFIYDDEKAAFDAMYKTFSLINYDEFGLLYCDIEEMKLNLLKKDMNINNLIKHGEFEKRVVITNINVIKDTIDLEEMEYKDDQGLKDIVTFLKERYLRVRGKEM